MRTCWQEDGGLAMRQREIDRTGHFGQPARQMSRIHIARNRQSIGQFSPEEVAEGLQTGEFLPGDLAWCEPMESWKPLAEFTDLPVVEPALVPPALDEAVVAAPDQPEPAWERRAGLGLGPAIFQTVQQVFATPAFTFKTMKLEGGFRSPLLLYVILLTLTTWAATTYQIIYFRMNPDEMLKSLPAEVTPALMISSLIFTMVAAPFFVAAGAFISSGIFHLILMALGAANKPYEATFRAVCYAMAPASLLQMIPMCGGVLYLLMGLTLLIIAIREVHQTENWRATVGVILPTFVCCGLFIGLYTTMALAK